MANLLVRGFLGSVASSRPLQATFSVAQPLFAGILAANGAPGLEKLALLFVGSLAGMFSVFALNDLLDYGVDRRIAKDKKEGWDIDSVFARHPLAQGLITKNQQIAWILATGMLSALVIYLLNPLALVFFALAALLEAAYCRMATISEWKAVVAGLLVAVGALVGWFAAGGGFELALAPLFLLFFAWEIGGRNIPNDFSDIEQDKALGIKTVPSVHGTKLSSKLVAAFALVTLIANLALGIVAALGLVYLVISTFIGIFLLLWPGVILARNPAPAQSLAYFNKASIYPVVMLFALIAAYII